ncbi:MAG: TonB-dependent receptor, partial [Candidatus Eisenbacteria bacterium]
ASSYRRLGFKLQPAGRLALDTSLPPESLLVDENIKPGYFELEEGTRENDSYRARQQTRAGYLMGDLALVKNVTLAGGARYEVSEQTVESKSPFVTNARETEALLRTDDLFPALNVTWRASSKMNLRAAFSKTLNRPELRELSPFDMYNYEIGMSEAGNPNLQATTIESYDARWELFPTPGEVFALSLFRKALPRPIESSLQGAGGNKIKSPVNGRDGTLKGFELEARAGLSKLTRRLDRFSGSANYSRVSSKARLRAAIDDAGMPIYTEAPLQGQSSYSLNVGLYYDDGSLLDGALLLGSFGKRLSERGVSGTPGAPLPDVYEYPPLSVDMTLGCKVGRGLRAKLAVENVLERGTEFRQLDKIQRRTDPGRSFSLSISSGKR